MLYVSTRNKADTFTAYRALHEDYAPDGGMFVPFRLPMFDAQQIASLKDKSFGETVAEILNLFFSARLNGWDVEFCIGRYPVKLFQMNHRIVIAEVWHNPGASFSYMTRNLYARICGNEASRNLPTVWAQIAVRIAVLFGLYGELVRSGVQDADIALPSEDFSAPLAAWYARSMGLPLGMIICGCMDGDPVWELIQKGVLSTNAVHAGCIEQLIYQTLGAEESLRYVQAATNHSVYQIKQEQLLRLNNGLFAAVAGEKRVQSVISSVYRMNASVINPSTALAFGCLQDYRHHTGGSRCTLLLAESSPAFCADAIASATGLSVAEVNRRAALAKE